MEADQSRFALGTLLSQTFSLSVANRWRIAIAFVVLCALGVLTDVKYDGSSGNLLFIVVYFVFQIWLTDAILKETVRRKSVIRGAGSAFGASVLSWLAILFGLVLFIVPGLVALVRWSMVVPVALADHVGVIEAMRRSWHRSAGHFWRILGLLMLMYVPVFGASGVLANIVGGGTFPVLRDIAGNVVLVSGFILGWHASLALFLAGESHLSGLQEVFA
jgi:membrane-anchored glycerophosphoryl diester phosphodiesterase (GDPDase)